MSLVATRPKRELCPAGVYKAHVANVEVSTHPEFGERVQFSFDLADKFREDGSPFRVFRSCSFKLTPKSTLTGIVGDILGRKLTNEEAEEGFDLESLLGMPVQVVVKHRTSESGSPYATVDTIIHLEGEPVKLPF